MSKTVEFLFDVGSPNAYLAWTQLPALAERCGAEIVWTPMLLGGVFKATGNRSPAEVPAKAAYMQVDMARFIKRYGVPFQRNPHFPVNTLTLMRGACSYQMDGRLQEYLAVVFDGMWVHPRKLDDPAELASVLTAGGIDAEDFAARIQRPEVKQRLIDNTEAAVARGVFGAPSFFVGDELYFGQDRLDMIEQRLREG